MNVTFGQDHARWDAFVRRSPQRSPYVTTAFLRALGLPFELVTVAEGDTVVAGAPLILGDDGRALDRPVPMTMYQGILLADHASVPPHRRIGHELELVERLAAAVAERHGGCCLSQSWRLRDVRALSWHNYHEPAKGQFSIAVAYTGILDLGAYESHEAYVGTVRELRRRELKKARGPKDRELLRRIGHGALDGGYGTMRVAAIGGAPASATLFFHDDRSAFYFFGANDPEHRATGASTYLMLENIREARERGLQEVDFIGVNSPQRGDYKVSFNAEIHPYFVARLRRSAA